MCITTGGWVVRCWILMITDFCGCVRVQVVADLGDHSVPGLGDSACIYQSVARYMREDFSEELVGRQDLGCRLMGRYRCGWLIKCVREVSHVEVV
jgi:hypothetical protein